MLESIDLVTPEIDAIALLATYNKGKVDLIKDLINNSKGLET